MGSINKFYMFTFSISEKLIANFPNFSTLQVSKTDFPRSNGDWVFNYHSVTIKNIVVI